MTIREMLRGKNIDTSKIDAHIDAVKFFSSVQSRNCDAIRSLANNGVDINTKDKDGWTALMYAVDKADKKIVRLLIELGVNVNVQDDDGQTALMNAIFINADEISRMLLRNGADVNVKDNKGQTPLMIAAYNNNKEIGELLILEGADIEATDNQGMTAFDIARRERGAKFTDYFLNTKLNQREINVKRMAFVLNDCLSVNKIGDKVFLKPFKDAFRNKYGYEINDDDLAAFARQVNKSNDRILKIIDFEILQIFPSYNQITNFILSLFDDKYRIEMQMIKDSIKQKYNCELEENDFIRIIEEFNIGDNNKIMKKENNYLVVDGIYASDPDLNRIGSAWFVSYAYYNYIDNSHKNWQGITTVEMRSSVYRNNYHNHMSWLKGIMKMDDSRLATNWIGLTSSEIKEMAKCVFLKILRDDYFKL